MPHMPHNFSQDIAKYKSPFKIEGLPEFPRPHRTDDVPGLQRRQGGPARGLPPSGQAGPGGLACLVGPAGHGGRLTKPRNTRTR